MWKRLRSRNKNNEGNVKTFTENSSKFTTTKTWTDEDGNERTETIIKENNGDMPMHFNDFPPGMPEDMQRRFEAMENDFKHNKGNVKTKHYSKKIVNGKTVVDTNMSSDEIAKLEKQNKKRMAHIFEDSGIEDATGIDIDSLMDKFNK